jgi:LuxR family transcriptional regulator, maltose regulon positive regulatory protein
LEAAFPFTKFVAPQLDERVAVDAIVERLRRAVADHPLTVVVAPAGSGKSTGLAAWARQATDPVAWVRVDAGDDAPTALAAALLAGVRRTVGGFGARLESVLGAHETASSAHHLVTSVVNDLGELDRLTIILDDLHELRDGACLALLDAVVDHLPPPVRLVVASRTAPTLSLARRRVRGELAEIGLDDLRLDAETIREIVCRESDDDRVVAAVTETSQGWAAAVRLAVARLHGGRTPAPGAVADHLLVEVQPELWRFLAEEVLDAQPRELREFLLDTAVLDELTPSACAAVSGRADAADVLDELDRRNLFVDRFVGESGMAWRYHDLFAAFLRGRLDADRGQEAVRDLHLRAAGALSPTRAVPHLLAAGEHDRVAEIAVATALEDFDGGALSLVLPWVEALPDEVIERYPRLALLLAWPDEMAGRPTELLARLEPLHSRLLAAGKEVAAAEIGLEIAVAHLIRGDVDAVGPLLEAALHHPLDDWVRVGALIIQTHWCRDGGDWLGASTSLDAAFELALGEADPVLVQLLASGLSSSHLFAQQGPTWVTERAQRLVALLEPGGGGLALAGLRPLLAGAALLRLDLETAAAELRRCLTTSREVGGLAWTHQEAEVLQLTLLLAAGDHAAVRGIVDAAFARMETSPIDASMRHAYAHARLRSAWLRGDRRAIERTGACLTGDDRPQEAIVRSVAGAMAARLEGRGLDEALASLGEAEEAQRELRAWFGVGLPGLERAAIIHEQGRTHHALEAVEPVLATAAELGPGLLLAEASSHTPLLRWCVREGLHAETVGPVLAALDRPAATTSVEIPGTPEALSARELEVLMHVARGSTNLEIATELYISSVTVKSHLTRIFRKLGASSRTHAVARARELHLL